ncbi:cytochrome c550 [Virgibacillus siamensis]|uniref:cytochrome c550 n=1 Tax=Virgibacillus siamensis TaxID=480071 RepID=UPI00098796DC|nr:cytochrome c [Virgibacillus siamensis]
MKNNPVIPYAIIAVVGILLVIVISVVGIDQRQAIEDEHKKGGEKQEQSQDSKGGETASTDPSKIFENTCASCHGADLSGGVGPNLQKVGSTHSKEEIREIIKNGFPKAGMPGGLLQGAEADAVAEWLSKKK